LLRGRDVPRGFKETMEIDIKDIIKAIVRGLKQMVSELEKLIR